MLRVAWSVAQFFLDVVIIVVAAPILVLLGRPTEVRNPIQDDGVVIDDDDPGVDVDE